MKILGLINNNKVRQYIYETYGLVYGGLNQAGLPVFTLNDKKYIGGFKNFYSVIAGGRADKEILDNTSGENGEYCFSIKEDISKTRLINWILTIDRSFTAQDRHNIYDNKTRNLVKKSYKNSFRVEISSRPHGFLDLYYKSMKRLHGRIKSQHWFVSLEEALTNDIICFSLYDNDRLVACNYCIRSKEYLQLIFNVSDRDYWQYCVNNRIYDEMISWSVDNNIEYVDFGPSSINDNSHNHFKIGYGAQKWYIVDKKYGGAIYLLKEYIFRKIFNIKILIRQIFT